MAKKRKNIRHQEAVNRRRIASEEMAAIGLSLDSELMTVGFVFSHLAVSQLTYLGIESINRFCKTRIGVDICIFSQHIIPPCLPLCCSVFSPKGLERWSNDPLISTSIGTTIDALSTNASVVYHYMFDPEFIGAHHVDSSIIQQAFCDQRVKVICRDRSHQELVEAEFGINVCGAIIPDCDAELLIKEVLTERCDG